MNPRTLARGCDYIKDAQSSMRGMVNDVNGATLLLAHSREICIFPAWEIVRT